MNILHYSLGFPPERTGGLVEYAIDLANEQKKNNNINFLYPGRINIFKKKPYIVRDEKNTNTNFSAFCLVNSLPLPIFGGIKSPEDFMKKMDKGMYFKFLKGLKLDVIHIHTLMGIHKEFFEAAKELKIPIIFTTHDYFGLAPEPSFFIDGKNYVDENTNKKWVSIANEALPTWKLRIFQLKIYKNVRPFLKLINKSKLKRKHSVKTSKKRKEELIQKGKFEELINYYKVIFMEINFFHFNSTIAEEIFKKFVEVRNYKVISISNKQVNRGSIYKRKSTINRIINIGYIGPYKNYKGFSEFLRLARNYSCKNYKYHIFGSNEPVSIPTNVINHGTFKREKIKSVFELLDVLIVPSLWYETFGFITIEALSFGTKVFVSQNVGSKNLIDQRFIFKKIDEVPNLLKKIDEYKIIPQKTMGMHCLEIDNLYKEISEKE